MVPRGSVGLVGGDVGPKVADVCHEAVCDGELQPVDDGYRSVADVARFAQSDKLRHQEVQEFAFVRWLCKIFQPDSADATRCRWKSPPRTEDLLLSLVGFGSTAETCSTHEISGIAFC